MSRSSTGSEKPLRDKALYDSNILIAYLFKEDGRFEKAKEVLAKHSNRYVSILSVHEIGHYSAKMGVEEKFMRIKPRLRQLLKILPLDQETCMQAIKLRTAKNLPEIDALIVATAIQHNVHYFYTFDEDFVHLHNRKIEDTMIIKL